ncbi:MAG: tetratricopeptide repeat protein [Pseudoxanthomonas sp.]
MESGTGASASTQGAGRYRFGDTVVDAAAHTISRNGRSIAVEPKAFAVLLVLLRRAGQLVPRDELLDAVWGHRHVTAGVLTRAIAQLRNALDDQAEEPRYIQTRHAVGYRFIGDLIGDPAEVDPVENQAESPAGAVEPAAEAETAGDSATGASTFAATRPSDGSPSVEWWKSPALWVLVAGLAVVCLISDRMPGRIDPALASIAVMPFSNLGGNKDDDYFAEGLAVEMHDALASVEGLKVAAQISSGAATAANPDVKALGRRLGVATVLDASVRREGRRMRINARLSDTSTGYTLWSHSYDRELSDVFATQGEIANEVVRSLMGVMPGRREALARQLQPTTNVAAFDFYLRGLQSLRRSSSGDKDKDAIGFFNKALASDAGFSRAQAALCMAEARRFEYWHDSDAYGRARLACARAADMDPALGEAALATGNLHRVRGEYAEALAEYRKVLDDPRVGPGAHVGLAKVYAAQGRKDLARQHFQRALALRPGDPLTHMEAGWQAHLDGRPKEAIDEYRKALALDPGNAGSWNTLGFFHLLGEDKAAAMRAFERSVAIEPNADALSNIGTLKFQAGEYAAAVGLYRKAAELDPDDHVNWGNLGEGLLAVAAPSAEIRAAFGEAEKRVDRYLQLNHADGEAVAALGWYRVNLGLDEDAAELVTKSTAMEGDAAEIALYNAETLAALGRQQDSLLQIGRARQAGLSEARIEASAVLRSKLLAGN